MKEVDEICGASERLSYLGKGLENISQLPTNTVYILKTEQPIQVFLSIILSQNKLCS